MSKLIRKFKPSDWKKMKVLSEPTETKAQTREDSKGHIWRWVSGSSQRVEAEHLPLWFNTAAARATEAAKQSK